MAARIKYEVDGNVVPSLNKILDNCKIGGIGNLLYRANQAGLSGRHLKDAGEDNTNAGWLAFKRIDEMLNMNKFDINSYSDACIERSGECLGSFIEWGENNHVTRKIKDLTLVSESLEYGDTFDIFRIKDHPCCLVMLLIQNEVYPENLIRLAARVNLLRENGVGDVTMAYILRVNNPKDINDPVVLDVREYDDFGYTMFVFKNMRRMYDMQDTLKTLV